MVLNTPSAHSLSMKSAFIGFRVDEVTKGKIERIVYETGLWANPSEFVREAVMQQIGQFWREVPDDY